MRTQIDPKKKKLQHLKATQRTCSAQEILISDLKPLFTFYICQFKSFPGLILLFSKLKQVQYKTLLIL